MAKTMAITDRSASGLRPRMETLPLSAFLVPRMHSIAVLFPAPLAPKSPNTVPRSTDRLR